MRSEGGNARSTHLCHVVSTRPMGLGVDEDSTLADGDAKGQPSFNI